MGREIKDDLVRYYSENTRLGPIPCVVGKQNNLRISALRDSLVPWTELCAEIRRFRLD